MYNLYQLKIFVKYIFNGFDMICVFRTNNRIDLDVPNIITKLKYFGYKQVVFIWLMRITSELMISDK
jgi:hypothetical protein